MHNITTGYSEHPYTLYGYPPIVPVIQDYMFIHNDNSTLKGCETHLT